MKGSTLLVGMGLWCGLCCTSYGKDMSVYQEDNTGIFNVKGVFSTKASPLIVWITLMDFDHLSSFVSLVNYSHTVESYPDNSYLVEQEIYVHKLLFSRHMHLLLSIQPIDNKLYFSELSHLDLKHYEGVWTVESSTSETLIHYDARVKADFKIPDFIFKMGLESGAQDFLDQLQKEMEKRSLIPAHVNQPALENLIIK